MSPFVHAKESQMFKLLQHASIAYSVLSVDAMSYFFLYKISYSLSVAHIDLA